MSDKLLLVSTDSKMPVLLVSLGTSWAVVPEAFQALPPGPVGFSAVDVLTTASPTALLVLPKPE